MPSKLTKADLISAIQTENGYTLKESADIVKALMEIMKRALESGEDVMISGFGKFQVNDKGEGRGRNPATDEDMILPGRRIVTFKCSGRLKDWINVGQVRLWRHATTYRNLENTVPLVNRDIYSID